MSSCIFCRIAQGQAPARIVYEDEHIMAFHDRAPQAATHLLVIPRRHITNLFDLDKTQDGELIAHLMLKIPEIARAQGLQHGFRTLTNTGKGGRQEVMHMHFHILAGPGLPALN